MLEFKGRVILNGECNATCVVSKKLIDLDSNFRKTLQFGFKKLVSRNKYNKELFKQNISKKVVITHNFKDSDGLLIESMCSKKCEPICFLIAGEISKQILSSILVCKTFFNTPLIVLDKLGEDFLLNVETGDFVSVNNETVTIEPFVD